MTHLPPYGYFFETIVSFKLTWYREACYKQYIAHRQRWRIHVEPENPTGTEAGGWSTTYGPDLELALWQSVLLKRSNYESIVAEIQRTKALFDASFLEQVLHVTFTYIVFS